MGQGRWMGSPLGLIAHGYVPSKYFILETFHFPLAQLFLCTYWLRIRDLLGFRIHTDVCVCVQFEAGFSFIVHACCLSRSLWEDTIFVP